MEPASWGSDPFSAVETNFLVSSVAVEALISISDGNSNSIRIVKLAKPVWHRSTAADEVGLTDEGISNFTNIIKSNYTVISQGLTPQYEMHTY